MQKHTVTVKARHLGLIIQAFNQIQGEKPIMLSYKFGRIVEPVQMLQKTFIDRIRPFLNDDGSIKQDLGDEDKAAVEALVDEELEFEVPTVTILDIAGAISVTGGSLTVGDDSVLVYLVDIGVIIDGQPEA